MAYWLGLGFFCYGCWLVYGGIQHKRRRREARERGEVRKGSGKLTVLAEVMPPLIFFGLGVAALEVIIAYRMIGPNDYFGLVDLIAFLYLLAAYAFWIVAKTGYTWNDTDSDAESDAA